MSVRKKVCLKKRLLVKTFAWKTSVCKRVCAKKRFCGKAFVTSDFLLVPLYFSIFMFRALRRSYLHLTLCSSTLSGHPWSNLIQETMTCLIKNGVSVEISSQTIQCWVEVNAAQTAVKHGEARLEMGLGFAVGAALTAC